MHCKTTIMFFSPQIFLPAPLLSRTKESRQENERYFKETKLFFSITLAAAKSLGTENPIRTKLLALISSSRYETSLQSYTQTGSVQFADVALTYFMTSFFPSACLAVSLAAALM